MVVVHPEYVNGAARIRSLLHDAKEVDNANVVFGLLLLVIVHLVFVEADSVGLVVRDAVEGDDLEAVVLVDVHATARDPVHFCDLLVLEKDLFLSFADDESAARKHVDDVHLLVLLFL